MDNFQNITDMLEYSLDPNIFPTPVVSYCLDITDQMNEDKLISFEGCNTLKKLLKSKNANRRLNVIKSIEIFVKNCNMDFHHNLLDSNFTKTLLKILEKRRGKKSFMNSLITNNKELQNDIENKILYLVQL